MCLEIKFFMIDGRRSCVSSFLRGITNRWSRRQLSFGCCLRRRFFTFPLLQRFLFVNVQLRIILLPTCPRFFSPQLLPSSPPNSHSLDLDFFRQSVACAAPLCANWQSSCSSPFVCPSSPCRNPTKCANYVAHYP